MIAGNRPHLERAVLAIDDFVRSHGDIEDIQRRLESCHSLLEGGESALSRDIFNVVEGLEEILFGRLADEQFPAAVFLLDSLRERLAEELCLRRHRHQRALSPAKPRSRGSR